MTRRVIIPVKITKSNYVINANLVTIFPEARNVPILGAKIMPGKPVKILEG
jgi:hypothetical protein